MDFPHAVTSISLLVSVVQAASFNEYSTVRQTCLESEESRFVNRSF